MSSSVAESRYWEYVDRTGPCWIWTGPRTQGGFGRFFVAGTETLAHRFSYRLHHGPIPSGAHVVHRCENRLCVHPDHLVLVDAVARFWGRVDTSGDCWQWSGPRDRDGYGKFQAYGRHVLAHRFAYEMMVEPIPSGMYVLHDCDNPGCVRPDHLHVGTQKQNVRESIERGRWYVRRGEEHHKAKLTRDEVRLIRERHAFGTATYRQLAEQFQVSEATIRDIIRNRTWQDEQEVA